MHFSFAALAVALLPNVSMGHLALSYEPERVRQETGNTEGFAVSDRSKEDFSLENPFDIFESLYSTIASFENCEDRNPNAALFIPSRLFDKADVDYYMYDLANENVVVGGCADRGGFDLIFDLVGYVLTPACKECKAFHPAIALLVPSGTTTTNPDITFSVPSGNEEFDVPAGYEYFIQSPASNPEDREFFVSRFSGNQWYLPIDYSEECIENYSDPDCVANPSVITALQLVVPPNGDQKVYFAVYDDSNNGQGAAARCRDFSLIAGTTDAFLTSDFIRLGAISSFTNSGRTVGDKCSGP